MHDSDRFPVLAALCIVVALGACSSKPSGAAAQTSRAAAGPRMPASSACDRKLIAPADVAGLLKDPITRTENLPGDPETCELKGGTGAVQVSLRPGFGLPTLASWKGGQMPVSSTPLPGVGDEAVWVADLQEVVSRKKDLLCDVAVRNPFAMPQKDAEAKQKALGQVCNTIYGRMR